MCIKIQHQIHNNEGWVKKTFWYIYSQKSVRNFSFLLQISYNEFNLEILYTDGVEWKEHVWFFSDFLWTLLVHVHDMCMVNSCTHDTFPFFSPTYRVKAQLLGLAVAAPLLCARVLSAYLLTINQLCCKELILWVTEQKTFILPTFSCGIFVLSFLAAFVSP
jgi:hypothetical protein